MPVDAEAFFKAVRNNAALKIISIVLAVASWYGIRRATSFEALIKDVPLLVRVDEGWAVLDQTISDVDVLFSGSLVDLRNLNRDQIEVEVDCRGRTETGSLNFHISHKNVRSPGGARAVHVDPADIRISLDRESDKQIPVKADIVGSPPEGFEVERVVCTPSTVTLRGPQRRLDDVAMLKTEPIDLEGRIKTFQLSRRIMSPAENWSARVQPDIARVEVSLVERSSRKDIASVPVRALSATESRGSVRFIPPRVAVSLEGTSVAIGAMEVASVLAFVDCSSLQDGKPIELPVRVSLPSGVRIVSVDPPLVKAISERAVTDLSPHGQK